MGDKKVMSNTVALPFLVFCIIMSHILGGFLVYTVMSKRAIEYDCAHYDSTTGKFTWNYQKIK